MLGWRWLVIAERLAPVDREGDEGRRAVVRHQGLEGIDLELEAILRSTLQLCTSFVWASVRVSKRATDERASEARALVPREAFLRVMISASTMPYEKTSDFSL